MAIEFEAAAKRHARAHEERAWLAWHIATLGRVKKIPRLESLLGARDPKPVKRQTPEQQFAMMKAMFLAFGGDPNELSKHDG